MTVSTPESLESLEIPGSLESLEAIPQAAATHQGQSVLVVDDLAIVRELIAAALTHAGFRALCARSAAEAWSILNTCRVDLILLEMALPEDEGLALLAKLAEDPAHAQIPVIALTGASRRASVLQAHAMGVKDYLLKRDFSLQDLMHRIRRGLRQTPAEAVPPRPPDLSGPGSDAPAHQVPAAPVVVQARPVTRPVVHPVAQPVARPVARPVPPVRASATPAPGSRAAVSRAPTSRAPASCTPAPLVPCPVLRSRDETLARLAALAPTRTLAGVVDQVVRLASSARADLADLVGVIQSDPVLASRVLQLANSAAFTTQRARIASVEEAVRNVGVKTIQQLALSVGIFENFPTDTSDGFNALRCWQHCYGTAVIMNLLMGQVEPEAHGLLHLIGLCHDLADLVLRQHFSEEYAALSRFATENGATVASLELQALGLRHHELVAEALARIGLPPTVTVPIREFFEHESNPGARMGPHARALAMANALATALQLAASPEQTLTPILRSEWRLLARNAAPPLLDPLGLRSQILTTTNLLARLPAADEAQFLKPLLPRGTARVWYLRHVGFLEPDPIELALRWLAAEVTVAPGLPTSHAQWAQIDAVVLLGPRPEAAPLISSEVHLARCQAGVPTFPVAFVTGQDQPAPAYPGMELLRYPVRLSDLARVLRDATPRP